MAHVFIFNAPPLCGKDYLADGMMTLFSYERVYKLQFKDKLFELTKSVYDIGEDEWNVLYSRKYKEVPTPRLGGLSPRQAMIFVSEVMVKPNLGKDYFGRHLANEVSKDYNGIYFISDGGFEEEVKPLINDKINLTVFKVSDGVHSFEQYNDSRSYMDLSEYPDVREVPLFNDKTMNTIQKTHKIIFDILQEDK